MNFINIIVDPIGLAALILGLNAMINLFSFFLPKYEKSKDRFKWLAFALINFALAKALSQEILWTKYLVFISALMGSIGFLSLLKNQTGSKWRNYTILFLDLLLLGLMIYIIFHQNQKLII